MEAMTTEELCARVKALEALVETMRQAILGNLAKRDELAAVSPAAPQQDDANG